MPQWFLSPPLATLRRQLDTNWPTRDRTSDGSIGDTAHAARRSDHNPDADGMVRALDVDRDIAPGFTARALAEAIVASRDARVSYLISNGQIVSGPAGPSPWSWRPYVGVNAHREHVHVSIRNLEPFRSDASPWPIFDRLAIRPFSVPASLPTPRPIPNVIAVPARVRPNLKMGDAGPDVGYLQRMVGGLTVDYDFGPKTHARVMTFQRRFRLPVTGVVDAETWHKLEE